MSEKVYKYPSHFPPESNHTITPPILWIDLPENRECVLAWTKNRPKPRQWPDMYIDKKTDRIVLSRRKYKELGRIVAEDVIAILNEERDRQYIKFNQELVATKK